MPAAQAPDAPGVKRSTKLLPLLFWGGVGLAPLAALLLLVGSGFILQVAAVLALLVVVLIGLSIALRQSGDAVRGEVEELVYEEIDHVRADIRGDITHAARTTHGQLMERIGGLHETVDALRHQVDVLRGQLERAAAQPPPPPHQNAPAAVPQGVMRRTETVQVTTKTMVVDPTEPHGGTVYGGGPAPRQEVHRQDAHRQDAHRQDAQRLDAHRQEVHRQDIPQQRRPDRSERVQARLERGYDRPEREYDRPEREYGPERAREQQSWTEQLLHERMERAHSAEWPQTKPRGSAEVERPPAAGRRRAQDPDEEVTGMRTTDRWAEMHSDERGGRELRMGERRSAVHADETGTHVRIEDRWATVRHEEYYPEEESHTGGHRAPLEEPRGAGRHGSRHDERGDRGDDRYDSPRYAAGTENRRPEPREAPRRSEARRERERERDWSTHDPEPTTAGHRRPDAQWSQSSYEEARRDEAGTTRWSEVRRDRPALPPSPPEPASRWGAYPTEAPHREDDRLPRRSPRGSEDDDEYGWNGPRDDHRSRPPRQIVDFEGNDDRWR